MIFDEPARCLATNRLGESPNGRESAKVFLIAEALLLSLSLAKGCLRKMSYL
jgi:hypothetical protein